MCAAGEQHYGPNVPVWALSTLTWCAYSYTIYLLTCVVVLPRMRYHPYTTPSRDTCAPPSHTIPLDVVVYGTSSSHGGIPLRSHCVPMVCHNGAIKEATMDHSHARRDVDGSNHVLTLDLGYPRRGPYGVIQGVPGVS